MPRRRLLPVAAAVLVACAVAGCSGEQREPGWSGEAALPSAVRGFTLQVPSGTVEVEVSEPTSTLDPGDGNGDDTTVDGGGSYLVVGWREAVATTPTVRDGAGVFYPADQPDVAWAPEVGVDVGDEVVDLPADGATAVAVADDVEPRVVVTVDGESQTLDPETGEIDAGAFAPYYEQPPVGSRTAGPCPVEVPSEYRVEDPERIGCDPGVVATVPYVADLGWARPDTTWLAATVSLSADFVFFSPREDPAFGTEALQEVTGVEATVDGEPAESLLPLFPGDPVVSGTRVDARVVAPVPVDAVPSDPVVDLGVRYRSGAGPFEVTASFRPSGVES